MHIGHAALPVPLAHLIVEDNGQIKDLSISALHYHGVARALGRTIKHLELLQLCSYSGAGRCDNDLGGQVLCGEAGEVGRAGHHGNAHLAQASAQLEVDHLFFFLLLLVSMSTTDKR